LSENTGFYDWLAAFSFFGELTENFTSRLESRLAATTGGPTVDASAVQ
jgi:hypothetical protein